MFDDVMGLMVGCANRFDAGVRDAFGTSIVNEVLSPILENIAFLRSFSEDYQRQVAAIHCVLAEAQGVGTSHSECDA
ncbi:hypothetical protein [Stutzerimonas decontaminans]|uniref:Uncharacterized protein n=1 Tax=Stutzerimonas stutzeri TaxID=316 RepID=A0A023WS55_STUST|nr:hypothetical protein [Stutzerimonas decontaminans]AHY42826.1 hypothetical protein UIB01_10230 [Stutzerimonas decontaminans]